MPVTQKDSQSCFGGRLAKYTHDASTTGCEMTFNIYIPDSAKSKKVPLLIFLSGLTCNEDNCAQKGFYQYGASQHNIAVLYPDTSPRKVNVEGEDESWDFGSGAGHYVNATVEPYAKNYQMYSYINDELPSVIAENFGSEIDTSRIGLTGHSMGGHGALTIFLKNPGKYKSVSAVAPISNPLKCPWGEKAFKGYFGEENWESKGKEHDSCELLKKWSGGKLDILVDQGLADNFYPSQLLPENLLEAAKELGQPDAVTLRKHEGYTHSYFFISTFATDHVNHHAKYLNA